MCAWGRRGRPPWEVGAALSDSGGNGRPLDLVLDVGKTRTKLLVLDADGQVVARCDRASAALPLHGYSALDTAATEAWLECQIAGLGPLRQRLARAVVTAHGAAFALVDDRGLVLPVPDYEFEGFDQRPTDWDAQVDGFRETLSPDLPRGLNGATQLDWLERHFPKEIARGQWMPYAQYWAWWLTGVATSEVTSLACHTHLWSPVRNDYSPLARRRGWAARFAPLRRAWEVVGRVRPSLAQRLGLSPGLRVHCGVHDSNACLARYLRDSPRLTLVSTGTWIVVMAPGAPARDLDPQQDLLGNVSVLRQLVPTGRFMGGREVTWLCQGADPALANRLDLAALVRRGVMALPGFEVQGGPFRGRAGRVVSEAGPVDPALLKPSERATLSACYAAQVTAWIVRRLAGVGPVILEGPFAGNAVFTGVLAALLPELGVQVSTDELEGTARGAWQLAHWTEPTAAQTRTAPAAALDLGALQSFHAGWLGALAVRSPAR